METLQTADEQAEERKERPPVGAENCVASETVASTDCIDSAKTSTEMKETEDKASEQAPPPLLDSATPEKKTTHETDDDQSEETFLIDSSPEKQPSQHTTGEDSIKSPGEEILSIPDEEEQAAGVQEEDEGEEEEHEEEEEEEEHEEEEEEEYGEMDDDEEIYVETTDRVGANEISDENSSESDISSDEYTDDDVDQMEVDGRKGGKDVRSEKRRPTSANVQNDDDEPIQILTDDDDEVEEGEEEEEDDIVDDDEDMDEAPPQGMPVVRRVGLKYDSDSSASSVEKSPRLKVKYRHYQPKLAAVLRKRSFKILNKRSMHVMEDSSDALVVCSDANLTTNLKSALVSPKEDADDCTSTVKSIPAPPQPEKPELAVKSCVAPPITIAAIESQTKTKETEPVTKAPGDGEKEQKPETTPAKEGSERSSNAISSTTVTSDDKTMPTATAVEVAEKIADSSDDALSVLSAKKSISAATAPLVHSSAGSAEPGEGKAKESNPDGAAAPLDDGKVSRHKKAQTGQEELLAGKDGSPPAAAEDTEPTADDVMEGIDDFMELNGSEGKGSGEDERDFNEDLAFQMDVEDEPVAGKDVVVEEVKQTSDEGKGEKKKPVNVKKSEDSAMDLTSSSEQQQQQQSKGDQSVAVKEVLSNAAPTITDLEEEVVDCSPVKSTQLRLSVAPSASECELLNIPEKAVVTSTPVASGSGRMQQKRAERVQEASAQQEEEMEVKREVDDADAAHSDATDEHEAQNLSTNKARPRASEGHQQQPPASRKRRRSVERDSAQSGAEQEESVEPAKKLKQELEANFQSHERVVTEYIETTPNTSVDEIQCHANMLSKEIQTLSDMIRDTEQKWNRLLHLKKVKEEILQRLNRRKHVVDITETRLGEVSVYNHTDSTNLANSHHHQQNHQRSSSVGPRPPTPPPEVEIRPASVSITTNYSHNATNGVNATGGGNKYAAATNYSSISNRRNSSNAAGSGHHNNISNTSGKRGGPAKDTNSFVSQFNNSNNAVTMVPLSATPSMIMQARASMNPAEIAKEKASALHVQRHLLPKPVLSNQQQILNNLAMSAGLTSLASGSGTGGNSGTSATALLNGHHGSGSGSSAAMTREQQHQQQLQIGRQGMRKDVSSIIADYRQKHPENVPRRGRRLKHAGGSSSGNNNGGMSGTTSTGNNIGSFGEGGAISLTALPGGKSPSMGSAARSSSTDSVAHRISELLAAAENSRPSSNDSSQSSSNLLSSLMSASGATTSSSSQQQFLKDVLVQFAKMSQNEQSLLSNLQLLANNAALSSAGPTTSTTNTVSSPQQSPQFQQQQQQQQQQQSVPQHHQASHLPKSSLPEVTLHPVMNSTAHSDALGSHNPNSSLAGVNLSAVNSSSNSLLHGILTKAASRPASGAVAAAAAAVAVNNFNSFSPTLARLLTGSERMNAAQLPTSSSSTVTSGALANLQSGGVIGGLNLSKNNSEISITPVVGSNFQQTLLAQQQQQQQHQHQHHQQQLQRLREQHLFKGESYLSIDDEADDSADRLVIDEGDDMGPRDATSKRRGAEVAENEVPQCQGCKKMEAKFVCAGCNAQWYCSRSCQVNAWDDHSEMCSG